jgi:hypothetical protein
LGLTLVGCRSTEPQETDAQVRADALAQAFFNYVDVYYGTRLAAEKKTRGPSPAAKLHAREDLVHALREVGADLPETPDDTAALKAAVSSVRETLVQHDYVFLPLGQGGESETQDLGIALAHVFQRDAARSLELWGRKVEYKRILYDPFIKDYFGWRAEALREQGPVYTPGRFSGSTIYIDHAELVRRVQTMQPPYDRLGFDGMVREIELRNAASLLFVRDISKAATSDPVERRAAMVVFHERVLWTAARYGDPDVALADISGLATGNATEELREAAQRVLAAIPSGTKDLRSSSKRAEVLKSVADENFPRLSGGG